MPRIDMTALSSRGLVYNISEEELLFTKQELAQYFRQLKFSLQPNVLRSIMQDTKGWAFAVDLIVRSYSKAPGYEGYLRGAMKTNIFELMETKIFDKCSRNLQVFLIRLSLIDHLSIDLIALLAKGDNNLITELEKQNAYVRRDNHIHAYLIHHLFLEFLRQKQALLTEEEKRETYSIAADWCDKNGFKIDALGYFERIGDYDSIVAMFFMLPTQVPQDIARYAAEIFARTPEETFDEVYLLAVMHVRTIMSLGLWQETLRLLEYYEARFEQLPQDDDFRNLTLGSLYYCWGIMRTLMCTTEDRYDFDEYYAKQYECLSRSPMVDPGPLANHPLGPWVSLVGSSRKGAPQEYINALARGVQYTSRCFFGAMAGADALAQGELKFYQDDARAAEPFVMQALSLARKHKQFEVMHRALYYLLRIAITQGNYKKAERALKDMESLLDEDEYSDRFITYDIALARYYCILGLAEQVPDWLKDRFTPYRHAYFIENFGNNAKTRYCYLTKDYPPLLAYMNEQRQRETILFERVEMLVMEACVHLKMKDKKRAIAVLQEAFEEAAPNNLLMPFVGMGKDMRTLSANALKDPSCTIPKKWLELINRKATSYAKRQSHIIAEYKQEHRQKIDITCSAREHDVLVDLSQGLSRTEIAASQSLSINTVKMVINNLYIKLGANSLPELIRIAVDRKLV
jgi:LuxR family maltose regulon positive regulatory protein